MTFKTQIKKIHFKWNKKIILSTFFMFIAIITLLATAQDTIDTSEPVNFLFDNDPIEPFLNRNDKSSNNTVLYFINESNEHEAFHTGDGYTPGELYDYGGNTPLVPYHVQYQEHSSAEYANLNGDDENKNSWASYDFHDEDLPDNNWINLWYHFHIPEALRSIIGLQVLWNGHDTLSEFGDFEFDIWNYTSNQWELIDRTEISSSSDKTFVKSFTGNISNYIAQNGSLYLAVSGDKTENTRSRGIMIYSRNNQTYYPDCSLADDHIHQELETIEYAMLPHLQKSDDMLDFCLWSIDTKHLYIDGLQLIKIIHDEETEVIIDQNTNTFYPIKEYLYPETAEDGLGHSFLHEVSSKNDDKYWMTNTTIFKDTLPDGTDYLDVTFDLSSVQNKEDEIKLVIRAKQTGFLTEILRSMITAIYGSSYYQKLNTDEFILDQFFSWMNKINKLNIYELIHDSYELQDSLSFTNNGCYQSWIIPLKIADIDTLQLRISGLPYVYQIDELFIETSKTDNSDLELSTIPYSIVNTSTLNVSDAFELIDTIDNQYLNVAYNDVIHFHAKDDSNLSHDKQESYALCSTSYVELKGFSSETSHMITEQNMSFAQYLFNHPQETAKTFIPWYNQSQSLKKILPSSNKIPHNTLYEDSVQVKITTGAIDDPSWYSYHWRNRKLITLNSSQVTNTLYHFPIVLKIRNDTDIKNALQIDASDLVFIDYLDNITQFPHEIESYDGNGNLTVWVNISTISSTIDTKVWMYYGNPNCPDQQNITGTWNNDILMVHHLEETIGDHNDSTQNDHQGVCINGVNQSVQGIINGADSFDGIDDYIDIGTINTSSNWTVSFWATSFNTSNTVHYPIGLSQVGSLASGIGFGGQWGNINNDFYIYDGSNVIHGGPQVTPYQWYYVTIVKTNLNYDLYVNGVFQTSGTLNQMDIDDLRLGGRSDDVWFFEGIIDEVSICNTHLDQYIIYTLYQNQKEPSTFINIGEEDEINLHPIADFIYFPDNPTTTSTVFFNSTSYDTDGIVVNWTWMIENNSYFGENVQHHFVEDGSYNVSLTIRDDNNGTDEIYYHIFVANELPVIQYTIEPNEPSTLDIVFFNSTSYDIDGFLVNWTWDFGDGNISYTENTTHQYMINGSYIVNFTITDDDNDSMIDQQSIYVGNEHPIVNYSIEPDEPEINQTVYYNSTSYDIDGYIVNWTWDFGDGNTSFIENVTHQYSMNGSYVVRLTAIDDDNATSNLEKIVLVGNQAPIVNFTIEPSNPEKNEMIYFNSTSIDIDGNITNWVWNFGDTHTSIGENVTHQYMTNGSYIVRLTVTDNETTNAFLEKSVLVGNQVPLVNFTIEPDEPEINQTVYFNSTSVDIDGSIVNWTWDFGNANISFGTTVNHSYNHSGFYTVRLTVTDNETASAFLEKTVLVGNQVPIVNFTFYPPYPRVFETVSFNSTSVDYDGSIVNWTWDFGDGNTSFFENVTHQYVMNGSYTVNLSVTDDDNASIYLEKPIEIGNQIPEVNFTVEPMFPRVFETVYFNSTSVDIDGSIVNWTWDFGDGNTSFFENVMHQYVNKGDYYISLTVTDNDGVNDSLVTQLRIGGFEVTNVSPGWNLISIPFNRTIPKTNLTIISNNTEYSWSNATSNLLISEYIFGWNRTFNSYTFANDLVPGYGYWLYSNVNASITSAEGSIINDSFITDVENGWNIIGVPFSENINKLSVNISTNGTLYTWNDAVAANLISTFIFGWNSEINSYQFSNWFIPGLSYWVYSYEHNRLLQFLY